MEPATYASHHRRQRRGLQGGSSRAAVVMRAMQFLTLFYFALFIHARRAHHLVHTSHVRLCPRVGPVQYGKKKKKKKALYAYKVYSLCLKMTKRGTVEQCSLGAPSTPYVFAKYNVGTKFLDFIPNTLKG